MSPFTTRPLPISANEAPREETPPETHETYTEVSTHPRSFRRLRLWLTSIATILILLGGGVYAFFQSNPFQSIQTARPTGFDLSTRLGSFFSPSSLVTHQGGITYILLMGIGGGDHQGSDLTDTIMVAGVNTEKKIVSLLSIPRDLYVATGKNSAGKINTLYSIGNHQGVGADLLIEKIREITGITVDHTLVIDFAGFRQAVDVLGWVDIDVPERLVDREFPDDNWGYKTLIVEKWLQTFDGVKALAYARSRHSTSDFSRSMRQQLLIKAIKEKVLASGVYSPSKIMGLLESLRSNIATDMKLSDLVDLAMSARDIPSSDIIVMNLNNSCLSVKKCEAGAFLYTPSRELFGGASVLIPENAHISRLSYYDDTRRLSTIFFSYSWIKKEAPQISIVTTKKNKTQAQSLALALAKLGFDMSGDTAIVTTTGSIESSHLSYYWHPEYQSGYPPTSDSVAAMKFLFPSLTVREVQNNEYITDSWPRIEIVLGDDIRDYTKWVTSPYYIPAPPVVAGSGKETQTASGERSGSSSLRSPSSRSTISTGTTASSWEKSALDSSPTKVPVSAHQSEKTLPSDTTSQSDTQTPSSDASSPPSSHTKSVEPGQWENF